MSDSSPRWPGSNGSPGLDFSPRPPASGGGAGSNGPAARLNGSQGVQGGSAGSRPSEPGASARPAGSRPTPPPSGDATPKTSAQPGAAVSVETPPRTGGRSASPVIDMIPEEAWASGS